MKDTNDIKTSELLPLKRGRGRPKTGAAKSQAERSKAYRQKLAEAGNKTLRVTLTEGEYLQLLRSIQSRHEYLRNTLSAEYCADRLPALEALFIKIAGYEIPLLTE